MKLDKDWMNKMNNDMKYTLESSKSFDTVVENLEKQVPEHKFRVLAVHDVQNTLAEKGIQRGPLKIVEVCNAVFAHEATQKSIDAAMFMPCRYTVYTEGDKTVVNLMRPSMISEMLPDAGLEDLADQVETTLKKIMEASV
jgi:uncharacterized protein (DUF302 family)